MSKNTIFFGEFEDENDIVRNFQLPKKAWNKILYANYYNEGYDGHAYVLFRKGKKLYEVHGAHCSCNGLERQWDPELVTPEYLCKSGRFNHENLICKELLEILA